MSDSDWKQLRVAFVLTGSFCSMEKVLSAMAELRKRGASLLPVLSYSMAALDSRFGSARQWRQRIEEVCGQVAIDSIAGAEPIGPQQLADVLVIAPASGNTVAKLTHGVTDTPALMAAKSHLRICRPVVLGVFSNDGLSANAKNIGELLNRKHIYFIPFGQDDPGQKPNSLAADLQQLPATIEKALHGEQLQPVLRQY